MDQARHGWHLKGQWPSTGAREPVVSGRWLLGGLVSYEKRSEAYGQPRLASGFGTWLAVP